MKKIHVTILTKVYNSEGTIRDTIESVLAQTDENWTYIIRDNGSTDSTGAICEEYAKKDVRITVLHNKVNNRLDGNVQESNLLIATNMSDIWGNIDGEYIAYLDGDDILQPEFVEKTYRVAIETEADYVLAGWQSFSQNINNVQEVYAFPYGKMCFQNVQNMEIEAMFWLLKYYMGPQWGKILRTSIFYQMDVSKISDNREIRRNGDILTTMYYWGCCKKICVLPDVLINYRENPNSLSNQLVDTSEMEEMEDFYELGLRHLCRMGIPLEQAQFLWEIRLTGQVSDWINNIIKKSDDAQKEVLLIHMLKQKIFAEVCAHIDPQAFQYIMMYIYLNAVKKGTWKSVDDYMKKLAVYCCEQQSVRELLDAVYDKENVFNLGYHLFGEIYPELKAGLVKRDDNYLELMHDKARVQQIIEAHLSA